MKRWLTGKEVMGKYDIHHAELHTLMEGGLPAYNPHSLNRYYPVVRIFSGNREPRVEFRPWEPIECPHHNTFQHSESMSQECYNENIKSATWKIPPEHAISMYTGTIEEIESALFKAADVETAIFTLEGQRLPSECIADLEGQLAEARQVNDALRAENDALRAEVMKLRTEAAEAEGAEADPFNLTPVQIRDLKAFIMKAEGKTTDDIGDELHPDTPGTSLKDVVGRSIRKGKNLIRWSDKTTV